MSRKIALWFLVGFAVACAWVVLSMSLAPATMLRLEHNRYFQIVANITAPVTLLGHYPLKYYWAVLMNALVYALVGFGIELVHRYSPRRASVV